MAHIWILNGPNLNLLGTREPHIYGDQTLKDIQQLSHQEAKVLGVELTFLQSNSEGELVDWIQEAQEKADGIILNAAAYTHTSVALYDAIKLVNIPVIELHLSNVFTREEFRHHSFVSPVAKGVICGFGPSGYPLAIRAMVNVLKG